MQRQSPPAYRSSKVGLFDSDSDSDSDSSHSTAEASTCSDASHDSLEGLVVSGSGKITSLFRDVCLRDIAPLGAADRRQTAGSRSSRSLKKSKSSPAPGASRRRSGEGVVVDLPRPDGAYHDRLGSEERMAVLCAKEAEMEDEIRATSRAKLARLRVEQLEAAQRLRESEQSLEDLRRREEQARQAFTGELRQMLAAQVLVPKEVQALLSRPLTVELGEEGRRLRGQLDGLWTACLAATAEVVRLRAACERGEGGGIPTGSEIQALEILLTTNASVRRFLPPATATSAAAGGGVGGQRGSVELSEGLRLLQRWKAEAARRAEAAAKEAAEASEREAEEARRVRAEEAKQYAALQSREKAMERAHLQAVTFEPALPYVAEAAEKLRQHSAAQMARTRRCEEAFPELRADAAGGGGGGGSSSSSGAGAGGGAAQLRGELDGIIEALVAVRASGVPQDNSGGGAGDAHLCAHEYSARVMKLCHRIDAVVKAASALGSAGGGGNVGLVSFVLQRVVDRGIVRSALGVAGPGEEASGRGRSTEARLRSLCSYSYIVHALCRVLGPKLAASCRGLMLDALQSYAGGACVPDLATLVAADPAVKDADCDALSGLVRPSKNAEAGRGTPQERQQRYQMQILRRSGDAMLLLATFIRWGSTGDATVFSARDAGEWLSRALQQTVLLLSACSSNRPGDGQTLLLRSSPTLCILLVERACYTIKQFVLAAGEGLLRAQGVRVAGLAQMSQAALKAALGRLKVAVEGSGGNSGTAAMCLQAVTQHVEEGLITALAPLAEGRMAVLSKLSCCGGINSKITHGCTQALEAYALVSSLQRFSDLAHQLDSNPTPEQTHAITEVIEADTLGGAVFGQLGPTPESQQAVLRSITSMLGRASGVGAELLNYTLLKVAQYSVRHSASPHFTAKKHTAPLSRVVCGLCAANPSVRDLIVAQFYTSCPLTVPRVMDCDWAAALMLTLTPAERAAGGAAAALQPGSALHSAATQCLTAMNFDIVRPPRPPPGQPEPEAVVQFQTRDKWLARMLKIFTTFCVVMIQPEGTPVSLGTAWEWLSGVVNDCIRFDASKHPLPFMMAATLDTFLRIVSPALCTRVGVPLYISTLRLVASEVVPKLDVSTGMLQLERKGLVEFLEAALDQGQGGDIPLFHELK